ncbi:MAG: DUF1064 domain-containing protein [Phycisphaerae bacterium]
MGARITSKQLAELTGQAVAPARRRNKHGVAEPDRRRWRGRLYDSRAEMLYAQQLELRLEAGELLEVVEQPRTWLGVPENRYAPDFLVIPAEGVPYYVDVKGQETPKFKRDKKLWAAYGRLELRIVMRQGGRFAVVERIPGGGGHRGD